MPRVRPEPPEPPGADALSEVLDGRRVVFSPGVDALVRELDGHGFWSSQRWRTWLRDRRNEVYEGRRRDDLRAVDRVLERMQAVLARERSWIQAGRSDAAGPP